MAKKTMVRIRAGSQLSGQWVNDHKTLITKKWTEVSATVAKSLVGSEYKGRPRFEFQDDSADNADAEDSAQAATEDE